MIHANVFRHSLVFPHFAYLFNFISTQHFLNRILFGVFVIACSLNSVCVYVLRWWSVWPVCVCELPGVYTQTALVSEMIGSLFNTFQQHFNTSCFTLSHTLCACCWFFPSLLPRKTILTASGCSISLVITMTHFVILSIGCQNGGKSHFQSIFG